MIYSPTPLPEDIFIQNIYTIHYLEHAKNFVFDGEKHDFWEFLYVDKGEVDVLAETEGIHLNQGEMIFFRPNEFHSVWANGKVAPNLIVMSFASQSDSMTFFQKRMFSMGDSEKSLLAKILKEASYVSFPPYHTTGITQKEVALFASKQLIKLQLEQLLISLIRKNNQVQLKSRISSVTQQRFDKELVNKLVSYLKDNLDKNISFGQLVNYSKISSTHIKLLFKKETGMSAMEYYRKIKIDKCKQLIREESLTITEISEQLGYESIHYLSRQFKKITGMSPREYAFSVQAKIT